MKAKDRLTSLKKAYKKAQRKKQRSGINLDYMEMLLQYFGLQNDLLCEIDKIEDPVIADILYLHYIIFLSLKRISEIIGREYRYTCKLHEKALREYSEILTNEYHTKNLSL